MLLVSQAEQKLSLACHLDEFLITLADGPLLCNSSVVQLTWWLG
jgi:hypothetical protein